MNTDVMALASPALPEYLRRHALERPGHVAVIDGVTGESATYAELLQGVCALAAGLRETGVAPGDRVGIVAMNSLGYVELLWALAELGAIAVPVNLRLNPKEAASNLTDAGAVAIVADVAMGQLAAAIVDQAEIPLKLALGAATPGWVSLDSIRVAGGSTARIGEPTGETTCTLLFTSGTTGRAKGCQLPHRTWTGYGLNMAAAIQMSRDDVYLALLPYFHVAGLGTLLSQMVLGGTVVTQPTADPARMYRLIERHGVTIVFVVPGITGPFMDYAGADAADTGTLRLVIAAAGLDRAGLADEVASRFDADVVAIYGQTESGTKITCATSDQLRANPRTYGSAMPGVVYRIVDADDNDVADGEAGELVIRGGTVMNGYWGRPEATARTLRGGWHHTGDTFVHEGDGMLRMVDRTKYLIKTGGENVYPQEVENVLRRHPWVADVAVVGIPDSEWGETVKAFVIPAAGAELARTDLDAWVRDSIAAYKAPRFIEFTADIPRNESGKILKNVLASRPTDAGQRVPRKDRANG